MSINKNNNDTYNAYLQRLQNEINIPDVGYIEEMLSQFNQLSSLSIVMPNAPVVFAIDYSKRKFLFFSNSFGGYSVQKFLLGGLDFMTSITQKDFFNLYNEEVFPNTISFLKNIPASHHSHHIISFNTRIINTEKKEIDVYKRCTYITSQKTNLPTYCIGMLIDISHFKNENIITLSFEKSNKETGIVTLIEKKCFYPYNENGFLTQQEKKILQYMADGLSSKMIASRLSVSFKTIDNHRTNMLRKTNTTNVAQLIAYAFQNKII